MVLAIARVWLVQQIIVVGFGGILIAHITTVLIGDDRGPAVFICQGDFRRDDEAQGILSGFRGIAPKAVQNFFGIGGTEESESIGQVQDHAAIEDGLRTALKIQAGEELGRCGRGIGFLRFGGGGAFLPGGGCVWHILGDKTRGHAGEEDQGRDNGSFHG
jgi:hypothetical protein